MRFSVPATPTRKRAGHGSTPSKEVNMRRSRIIPVFVSSLKRSGVRSLARHYQQVINIVNNDVNVDNNGMKMFVCWCFYNQ